MKWGLGSVTPRGAATQAACRVLLSLNSRILAASPCSALNEATPEHHQLEGTGAQAGFQELEGNWTKQISI